MNIQKLIILISALLGGLSILLPWFDLPVVGNIDGIKVDNAWLGFILFGLCIPPVITGNKMQRLSSGSRWVKFAGIAASIFGAYHWYNYKNGIREMGDDNFVARAISDTVSIQYGLILFIAAGVVIFIAGSRK